MNFKSSTYFSITRCQSQFKYCTSGTNSVANYGITNKVVNSTVDSTERILMDFEIGMTKTTRLCEDTTNMVQTVNNTTDLVCPNADQSYLQKDATDTKSISIPEEYTAYVNIILIVKTVYKTLQYCGNSPKMSLALPR